MKNLIPGSFPLSESELNDLCNSCIFVLDTNTLLNLYRYSNRARSEWMDSLKKITDNDQLWIPHQVILEYCNRRLSLINSQKDSLTELKNQLSEIPSEIEKKIKIFQKHTLITVEYSSVMDEIKRSLEKIKDEIEKYSTEKDYPNRFQNDEILTFIEKTFRDKIGKPFSPDGLIEIFQKGEIRYKLKIPPGYCDQKEECGNRYGDLIIWYQILEEAKSRKKPMIFVTAEEKLDWWLLDFKKNNKIISPRPELINEFFSLVGLPFYIISTTKFINWLSEREQKNKKDAIQESQTIESENRELNTIKSQYTLANLAERMQEIQSSPVFTLAERIKEMQQPWSTLAEQMKEIQQPWLSYSERMQEIQSSPAFTLAEQIKEMQQPWLTLTEQMKEIQQPWLTFSERMQEIQSSSFSTLAEQLKEMQPPWSNISEQVKGIQNPFLTHSEKFPEPLKTIGMNSKRAEKKETYQTKSQRKKRLK
jgi:hypothetical protein